MTSNRSRVPELELAMTAPDTAPQAAEPVLLGSRPTRDPWRREFRDFGIQFIAATLVASFLVLVAKVPAQYAAAGVIGFAFLLLCARRPIWGCAALVVGTPLLEGLGRGTLIPFLRPSEALMAVLIVGVLVHEIPKRRRTNYTGMDVAVLAYALGVTLIPVLVLLFTRQLIGLDTTTMFSVFSPLQYLAIYLLFSRLQVADRDRRLFLNLAMAASVVVSLVGIAELANLPGVVSFVTEHYPAQDPLLAEANSICEYGVCRPSSLMQHYSAFGAYAVLSYTIALALLTTRATRFDRRWLMVVLVVNAVGVFASETYAAVLGLVLATAAILVYRRTFPRQLIWVAVALVIGIVAFWGPISARLQEQTPVSNESIAGITIPQSMLLREQYWTQIFWPDLKPIIWTGSGNVIPSDIVPTLSAFVDSEFLGMGFRAGIGGEVLLLVMLGVVAVCGWRARKSPDPLEVAIGGMAAAYVIVLAVMGITAEYLTYAGVDQAFWMVIGLLAGFRAMGPARAPEPLVIQVFDDVAEEGRGRGAPRRSGAASPLA